MGKKKERKKERSIEEEELDFNCNTGHGSCNFNKPIKEHLFSTNLTHSIAVALRFSFKLHTIIRLIYTLFLFIHIAILHIKIHLWDAQIFFPFLPFHPMHPMLNVKHLHMGCLKSILQNQDGNQYFIKIMTSKQIRCIDYWPGQIALKSSTLNKNINRTLFSFLYISKSSIHL